MAESTQGGAKRKAKALRKAGQATAAFNYEPVEHDEYDYGASNPDTIDALVGCKGELNDEEEQQADGPV